MSQQTVELQAKVGESSDPKSTNSDACMESDHSDDQAAQNAQHSIATRSGRIAKSTKYWANFVYF